MSPTKSQEGAVIDTVYGQITVSHGIAPILNTLSSLVNLPNKPAWSLYLINVETLIRDRKVSGEEGYDSNAALHVLQDCTVLTQYINSYVEHGVKNLLKEKPIVCFYLPHYERLPVAYLRPKLPKGTEERWQVRAEVEKLLRTQGWPLKYDSIDVLFTIAGVKGGWPHKDVWNDLYQYQDGLRFRNTLMVSHVPLDFHLYRVVKGFTILESYTGALKNIKQLGKKVFSDEIIPFNKYTHLLLGDKWYMKPLLDTKTKRMLRERAAIEHWTLLSDKAILESLAKLRLIPYELYTKPNI